MTRRESKGTMGTKVYFKNEAMKSCNAATNIYMEKRKERKKKSAIEEKEKKKKTSSNPYEKKQKS